MPRPPHARGSLRSPLRSFALGGLLGAAGTFATVRRLHRARHGAPAGLAAFEDAPCFVEAAQARTPLEPDDGEHPAE